MVIYQAPWLANAMCVRHVDKHQEVVTTPGEGGRTDSEPRHHCSEQGKCGPGHWECSNAPARSTVDNASIPGLVGGSCQYSSAVTSEPAARPRGMAGIVLAIRFLTELALLAGLAVAGARLGGGVVFAKGG